MNKNYLLCGVGGQGTVLAAKVIAEAAIARGEEVKTTETIGMAQRGGPVTSFVRTGEDIHSPIIPLGKADAILGFEPGEAAANLRFLKPGGSLIVVRQEVTPVTAALGISGYQGEKCLEYLLETVGKCYMIDGDKITRTCGSPKVLNVAVVGALCATGEMDLSLEDVRGALRQRLKPSLLEMNDLALELGAAAVTETDGDNKK